MTSGNEELSSTSILLRRVLERRARISVLGQDYVGLSLAAAAANAGFLVVSIDADHDSDHVYNLDRGLPEMPGVDGPILKRGLVSGRLSLSTKPDSVTEADLVFICIPTPLLDHSPDMNFVETTALVVSHNLRPGCLVVLESTTYSGPTDSLIRPILERSGLRAGEDFLLAYSPGRVDPDDEEPDTPRMVGGFSAQATEVAVAFYEQIVDKVIPIAPTPEVISDRAVVA